MRRIAGVLLVCAAVLKAVELVNEPAVAMLNPVGRFFVAIQIGVELGLGLFVLSGLYWSKLRWLLLILFAGFAGYSLYLALNGAASCGCFGPLRVEPWWTFLLDVAIVCGLAISPLRERVKSEAVGGLDVGCWMLDTGYWSLNTGIEPCLREQAADGVG